jgi:ribosomal protein L24
MTDYTKYVPYAIRALRHNVKPPGWVPPESGRQTSPKFLDVTREPSLKNRLMDQRKAKAVPVDMVRAMNLRAGDSVRVLFGRDAGNTGIIQRILHNSNQVIVHGCNLVSSYLPSEAEKQTRPTLPQQVVAEAPIHVANIAPLDPVTKRPTRIKRRYSMTGECVRISKHSGCAMPEPAIASPSLSRQALATKSGIKAGVRRGAPLSDRTVNSWMYDQSQFRRLRDMSVPTKLVP